MISTIALILLAGLCDRVRGGFPTYLVFGGGESDKPAYIDTLREFFKFAYGMVLALIVTDVWWQVLAAGPLWWLGTRQDFGGMFRIYWPDKPGGWLHILRVGVVWPLPVTALAYWNPVFFVFIPAGVVGNSFAHLLALHTPAVLPRAALELCTKPAWSELYRGLFIAAAVAAFGSSL